MNPDENKAAILAEWRAQPVWPWEPADEAELWWRLKQLEQNYTALLDAACREICPACKFRDEWYWTAPTERGDGVFWHLPLVPPGSIGIRTIRQPRLCQATPLLRQFTR